MIKPPCPLARAAIANVESAKDFMKVVSDYHFIIQLLLPFVDAHNVSKAGPATWLMLERMLDMEQCAYPVHELPFRIAERVKDDLAECTDALLQIIKMRTGVPIPRWNTQVPASLAA